MQTEAQSKPEFKFLDAHAHLRVQSLAVENLLATMDSCGIERTIVVGGGTVSPEILSIHFTKGGSLDIDADNAGILASCGRSNGRLLPFFFANPFRGVEPYREAHRDFHGLKLAPIVHGIPFADSRIHDLVAAAAEFQHPIYLHCLPREGFGVADLVDLAAAHPEANIIMGHGGVGHGDFHGISLIEKQRNIFFEISGSFSFATKIAWQKLGAERVLFGTEYPLQHPCVELEKMRVLDFPEADYRLMMRENILRLVPAAGGIK